MKKSFFVFYRLLIINLLIIFFTGCLVELSNNSEKTLNDKITSLPSTFTPSPSPLSIPTPTRTPFPTTTITTTVIKNDTFWKDTYGSPIYSQGGGVFKFGSTYYWYGCKYNRAIAYQSNPTGTSNDTSFVAITCYASQDLINWEFKNDVFTAFTPGVTINSSTWVFRMGVVYNALTNKYVLITQYSNIPGSSNYGILFATGDTPTDNFVVNNIVTSIPEIANSHPGDQTLFQDDDGKAYLICSSCCGRYYLYVIPLRTSDFLALETPVLIFSGAGREGNCMFKYNGKYYFCSSDLHGWNASHCYYIYASNITGPYSASSPPDSVMAGTDADFSHVSQTGFFITVKGSVKDTVIFCGDRWCDFGGNGLGYNQWCPLSFDEATDTIPQFNSVSEWVIDAATGNWTVGSGNNYCLNPSFEADRIVITPPPTTLPTPSALPAPAGWTTATNLSTGSPHSNANSGHTGRWFWQMSYASAYEGSIYQNITGLPNGSYTLSVWVKNSGGQSSCQLFANNYNGSDEMVYDLSTSISSWTKISIPNINVADEQCTIGIRTIANAGNWCQMDDFMLILN